MMAYLRGDRFHTFILGMILNKGERNKTTAVPLMGKELKSRIVLSKCQGFTTKLKDEKAVNRN